MKALSKVTLISLLILLLSSVVLVGCGDDEKDTPEITQQPTENAITNEPMNSSEPSTPIDDANEPTATPSPVPTIEPTVPTEYVPLEGSELIQKMIELRTLQEQKMVECWAVGDANVGRGFFQRSGPAVEACKKDKIVTDVAPRTWLIQMPFSQMSLFETDEGLVLIDTGGAAHGPALLETIRELSDKPMHTAIYTHAHIDHAYGLWAFEEAGELPPNIIAHEETPNWFDRYLRLRDLYCRMNNQRLVDWPDEESDITWPTQTYEDTLELEIGGEKFVLNHDRGETDDHTWVWVPDRKILCSADFFLDHLGNLGNSKRYQRHIEEAAFTLEEMAGLGAEIVLPGHGDPIHGAEEIQTIFLTMAEIWKSIVEQTIDGLNAGLSQDAIFRFIELPEEWANYPPASPCYSSVEDYSRMIIKQYAGWWDFLPANLDPASLQAQGQEIANLAGGIDALMDRALELKDTDVQMACHYAQWAYNVDPANVRAQDVVFEVFFERGMQEEQGVDRLVYLVDVLLPFVEERTGMDILGN